MVFSSSGIQPYSRSYTPLEDKYDRDDIREILKSFKQGVMPKGAPKLDKKEVNAIFKDFKRQLFEAEKEGELITQISVHSTPSGLALHAVHSNTLSVNEETIGVHSGDQLGDNRYIRDNTVNCEHKRHRQRVDISGRKETMEELPIPAPPPPPEPKTKRT